MRILILGGAGMLGHKMVQVFAEAFDDVRCTLRQGRDQPAYAPVPLLRSDRAIPSVDLSNAEVVRDLLGQRRPEVVINCAGLIKQRPDGQDLYPCIAVNALLPHLVAATLRAWGGRLVHFSTDCVFSGQRGHYTETDPTDAQDVYGRTKALGETADDNALTLRTSIIGRELSHHQSLLDWFLSQRGKTVKGFRRHYWSGVTTNHLAALTLRLVREYRALSGVYQVSSGRMSKYDLLQHLKAAYSLPITIEPDDVPECDRSLRGDKLAGAIRYDPPAWPLLLDELVRDPTPYPSLPR